MYFVFEGIDGSGKDSMAEKLAIWMEDQGQGPLLLVYEPEKSLPGGVELRELLKSGKHREAQAGLFLANRMALHATYVVPAMKAGQHVISVRSFVSTLVYQQEQWPLDWLVDLHRTMLAKPNVIFLLDVDPKIGLERATRRPGHAEMYEKIGTLRKIQARYKEVLGPDGPLTGATHHTIRALMSPPFAVHIIDASQSIEETFELVKQYAQQYLELEP